MWMYPNLCTVFPHILVSFAGKALEKEKGNP
jgi:hypothetical protein